MSEELTQVAPAPQVAPVAEAPVDGTPVITEPVVAPSSSAEPSADNVATSQTEVPTTPTQPEPVPEPTPAAAPAATTDAPKVEPAAEAQPVAEPVNAPNKVVRQATAAGPRGGKPGFKARGRQKISPQERKDLMKKNVMERNEFASETFVDMLVDYATKNQGFDGHRNWGNSLCTMFTRLARNLREKMAAFSPSDADYMVKQLMQCLADEPLGSTVNEWRENFSSNGEQRKAIDRYFHIDGPLFKIPARDLVMIQVRNAAWPSIREEENKIGGTFAERFFYLTQAIVDFSMVDGVIEQMCEKAYHQKRASWIDAEGKCSNCGSQTMLDTNGNTVCSNKFCRYHRASVSVEISRDYGRAAMSRRPARSEGDNNGGTPPSGDGMRMHDALYGRPSKRSHGGNKRRKDQYSSHSDGGEIDLATKPKKRHDKRWRVNEFDTETTGGYGCCGDSTEPQPQDGGRTVFSSGQSDGFGSLGDAFGNLTFAAAPSSEQT